MEWARVERHHYPEIREIYLQGIATGFATFQADAPEWEAWHESHLPHSQIVALEADAMRAGSRFPP